MRTSIVAGSLVAALFAAAPVQAQRVGADVIIRSGPISGRVVVNDGYSTYRRAPQYRRVVVVERVQPRLVQVYRFHRHHEAKDWRRYGYRPVTVYYVDGRYYDHWVGYRPGLREVVVYERDGRYFRGCDHDRRHDHDRHDHDRHDHEYWDD